MQLYNDTAIKISRIVTESYSTSFSLATGLLEKEQRDAIYSIYGFVRLADEIVDTFHEFPKKQLLRKFEADLQEAIRLNISLNPVLHSFLLTIKKYDIPYEYIDAFLTSMKYDLSKKEYNSKEESGEYIYGSADVVGLMCLSVFTNGCKTSFKKLEKPAMKLGSAFQKVNFIRDLRVDTLELGRNYFPEISGSTLTEKSKTAIVEDIENDFKEAYKGICELPKNTKMAVLLAYYYYRSLLHKIKKTPSDKVLESRIRISDLKKIILLVKVQIVCKLNLI